MSTPVASASEKSGDIGDPRPARSRGLILDAALEHFLVHGYLASTVDGIAVEAGVAKRTVYNLFPAKDELFRAVIRRATETAERFVAERVESEAELGEDKFDGFDDELTALARAHARAVLNPRVIATRRLLIGESRHFPELASEYFDRVPSAVLRAIALRLERYSSAGLLELTNARLAADHFAYLVLGATLDRALFEPGLVDPAAVDATAAAGAAVFLRAYGVRDLRNH